MTLPRPRGILCCGNLAFDIPVWPVDQFRWGTTLWVDEIRENVGGNGGNTSYALAKLGARVRLIAAIGQDAHGDSALSMLASVGVDHSHVLRTSSPTNTSICVVHSSGDRLFLHQLGASVDLKPDSVRLDAAFADGYDHFHIANIFAVPNLKPELPGILRQAKALGMTTSLDTGWDGSGRWMQDVEPCLAYVDLFFVNDTEAEMLTGIQDPEQAAARLHQLGAKYVLLKLGGQGSLLLSAEGSIRIPGFSVPVKDTTGAGDCYAGGLLAGLFHGLTLEESTRLASAVGALNVQHLGSITGLLDYEGTRAWMAAHS
jgi:sugar/nucleoside kinase (ribokinase family)